MFSFGNGSLSVGFILYLTYKGYAVGKALHRSGENFISALQRFSYEINVVSRRARPSV